MINDESGHLRSHFVATENDAATEALEQQAVALEERSRSLASQNERLQDRLDAALGEMKVKQHHQQ